MDTHTASPDISRHKCLIYDGHPSEQLPVVLPLLEDGLEKNWRCLYLGAPEMVQMVDTALVSRGLDTRRAVEKGSLLLSSDRSHLESGRFDPQAMIDGLVGLIDRAVDDGFEGLCATGDMRWELGEDHNFEHLLEYEAKLEQVFRDRPLRGICQYHRDVLPAQAIQDALATHQSAYIGTVLNSNNLFYMPPELLLETGGSDRQLKQGEWMCQQIVRVLDAEQRRDRALRDLAELNRDLERRVVERTTELEVAMRQLESFSYSVSHDLRAPLRAIGSFAEILAEDFGAVLGGDGMAHLDRVRGGVRRMGELIEGMLALSRVVKSELTRVPVDLTELAEDAAREARESDTSRSAEFIIHRGLVALGDRALLRAVLGNLVGNAWKFAARQTRARIEVGQRGTEGAHPVFFVKDNGAGFDMQYAKKLFAVFQRLHSEEEYPGTGVGLATVQRIVERHGGRIWAVGKPGAGATFFFTLPRP